MQSNCNVLTFHIDKWDSIVKAYREYNVLWAYVCLVYYNITYQFMNIIANRLASACKQEQKSQNYYYIHASCKSLFESKKKASEYFIIF